MADRSPSQWRPELTELDLSLAHEHNHPDFNTVDYFLAEIDGILRFGKFVKVWFGWHFSCGFGDSGGMQFDAPGYNKSRWQRVWRCQSWKTE